KSKPSTVLISGNLAAWMRRLTALLIRLAFSASASFPITARGVAFSRLAWSSTAGRPSAMPGSLSQRSFSTVSSSRSSCFMIVLVGRVAGVTCASWWVVDAEVGLAEHDVVQRRIAQTQRGELGPELSLVTEHKLDILDADVSGTHDLVHRGARLANTEELREVGQAQELAPQRTPTRRERLKVLGANISEAGDERLLWTQLAKLTQFARVGGIFDVRSGVPRALVLGDALGADEHAHV